jgi:hypothetical protein
VYWIVGITFFHEYSTIKHTYEREKEKEFNQVDKRDHSFLLSQFARSWLLTMGQA